MWTNRFVIAALLAGAGLFSATNSAHAQSYFYGYYYPDRREFVTFQEGFAQFQENLSPVQVLPSVYGPQTSYYYAPVPVLVPAAATASARVEVIVPAAQARVWFDGTPTGTLGADRIYQTPLLPMGNLYGYRIKASWQQGARQVTQEQTVYVTPGQTSVVDFTR